MGEIGCCQFGDYIPSWEFAEFASQEDHLNKQTLKMGLSLGLVGPVPGSIIVC